MNPLSAMKVQFVINMNSEPDCKNMIVLFRVLSTTFALKAKPVEHQKDVMIIYRFLTIVSSIVLRKCQLQSNTYHYIV